MTKIVPPNIERQRFANVHALVAHATIVGVDAARSKDDPDAPIYSYAILDLKRESPLETDEEAYARNERVMLAAAAEVERLKPIVGAKVGCEPPRSAEDERRQMRAVIEAMRPIVDAVHMYTHGMPRQIARVGNSAYVNGDRLQTLVDEVHANRDRLAAAMAAWEGGKATEEPGVDLGDVTFQPWPPRSVGGQHVGVTSGIVAVHGPTGLAAISIDERSQLRNRDAAIAKLRRAVFAASGGRGA